MTCSSCGLKPASDAVSLAHKGLIQATLAAREKLDVLKKIKKNKAL